ncbi:MAG TPA: hypothetical protein VGI75_12115 [Pirellulales bacterium]
MPVLFAVNWEDLIRLSPFIIALLVWIINRFAGAVPPKPPVRKPMVGNPAQPPVARAMNDPLQSEIDEFLKQAKSLREGKSATSSAGKRNAAKQGEFAVPTAGSPSQRSRQRNPFLGPGKRMTRREQARPVARTAPIPPPVDSTPARESVAEHVAQALDRNKFDRRDAPLTQSQQDSDKEFRQHMERVFQRDLVTLKPVAGIFEAAAASAAAATADTDAKAVVAAAGSTTATAPNTIRQSSSDIALFLAGRKNIRDAVILSEILQRPVQRW